MRTEPSVKGDSARYKPLLPKGTDLYVIAGPKHGSGYHWYEVSPVTFLADGLVEWPETVVGPGTTGWVPVASRDGRAWLAHGKVQCPATPTAVKTLARLTIGARLACFSGVPITVRARLAHWDGSIEGPTEFRPAWFNGVGQGLEIIPPATRLPPEDEPIWLILDPHGSHPSPLPVDEVVTVTGVFDHPAAARCRARGADEAAFEVSNWCRHQFVVTSIK
jgi:hypothetical protein